MKKTICAFLAMVMCMALALPAFAGSVNSGDTPADKTKYEGEVKTPTIKVTASAQNAVILNPYQISYAQSSLVSGGDATLANPSVIAPTLVLKNQSNVPLNMSLQVSGEVPEGSTAKFSATEPQDDEKNHAVFMFVDVNNLGSLPDNNAPTPTRVFTNKPTYTEAKVYNAETNNKNDVQMQAVVKAGDVKMQNFMTLAVPNSGQKGYVVVDIGGVCAKTPTAAWVNSDKVNVTLTFSFVASANTGSGS